MRMKQITMLNKLIKLKRYNIDGQSYYKVSDMKNILDDSNPDDQYVVDGLKSGSGEIFKKVKNVLYVLSSAVADVICGP